jgi:hypothetical protein
MHSLGQEADRVIDCARVQIELDPAAPMAGGCSALG